jgi:hypothetical protein
MNASMKLIGSRRECRQGCMELASRWTPNKSRRSRDRLDRQHLAELLSDAWGIDTHCAGKLVQRHGDTPYQQGRHVRRVAGFVRSALLVPAAANALGQRRLPRLEKLMTVGARYSRTGLSYFPAVDVDRMVRAGQSPGAWDRWAGAVMRRADKILSAWDTHPSYSALQAVVQAARGRDDKPIMPRAHRAAVKVAAATLSMRFGAPPDSEGHWDGDTWHRGLEPAVSLRDARAVLIAFRLFRRPDRSTLLPLIRNEAAGQQLRDAVDAAFGPQGDDDRVLQMDPTVICWSGRGAILAERLGPQGERRRGANDRTRIVQVVVRDPANGHRHHLTVPSYFALPLRSGESAARRVHAAVAWTFGLTPDEYRPATEA